MVLAAWRASQRPKMTQSRLAKTARISSVARYWQIENGEGSTPTTDEKIQIAEALGVRVGDIEWPTRESAVA